MFITVFFLLIFLILLRNQPKARFELVFFAFFSYLSIIFIEQAYLEIYFNRSFHVSDPSGYIDQVKDLSLDGLLSFVKKDSNGFNELYYIINWLFYNSFYNLVVVALFIKITNVLVFLSAYLLLWGKNKPFDKIEFIVLFHPWLFYILIRNLRDAYIILILSILIYIVSKKHMNILNYILGVITSGLMFLVRPFMVIPMLIVLLLRFLAECSKVKKRAIIIIIFFNISIGGYIYSDMITSIALNNFLGSAVSFGAVQEETLDDEIQKDMTYSSDLKSLLLKKSVISFPVFLFTPHPYNWTSKYLEHHKDGMYEIYTDFDNVLIIIGAVLNYLIFIPVMFKSLHYIKRVDFKFVVIPLYIFLIYSFFLLGNADLRIRYTFLLFVLYFFYRSGLKIYTVKSDLKYFLMSGTLFMIVLLI